MRLYAAAYKMCGDVSSAESQRDGPIALALCWPTRSLTTAISCMGREPVLPQEAGVSSYAAFADGGVNGFLDHAIWVRCHSTPSRSFLEPPICPSLHNLSPQETSSLPYHSSTCASASSACGGRPALSTAIAMSRAMAMTALIMASATFGHSAKRRRICESI